MEGFDYSTQGGSALATAVKAAGGSFVVRYLSTYSKGITSSELASLHKAGLAVGLVYETTGTTFTGGYSAGVTDGTEAARLAKALGAPDGTPIWFAIDTDTADFKTVKSYLQGCAAASGLYVARLYGSYAVCEAMGGNGHWLTYAWSNGKVSKHAGLYQYHNGFSVGGVDTDRCRTINGGPTNVNGWLTYTLAPTPAPAPSPGPTPTPAPSPGGNPLNLKDKLRLVGNKSPHAASGLANALKEHNNGGAVWKGLCLKFVRTMLGVAAGAPRAIDAWNQAGSKHQHSWYNPPAGVPVFWSGGSSGAGHVALADGFQNVWSSDIRRPGKVDLVPISEISAKWGLKYLGWSDTLNGTSVYS